MIRIEPCESWGKYILEVKIGDKWYTMYVGYLCEVEKMRKLLEKLIEEAQKVSFYNV